MLIKARYLANISGSGDVSLSLTHQFYPQIQLSDEKQRLIMAIDYIAYKVKQNL